MKTLLILNDPPYGTERSYNGLRLARELLRDPAGGAQVKVFLGLADAELAKGCARSSMAELAAWTGWPDKVLVF